LDSEANIACYASPEECEAAFYEAFREGDLTAMERIWDADAGIVCIHPARPPIAGRRAVMQSWADILGATGGVHVRFDCHSRVQADSLAVHMGLEIIGTSDNQPALVTVTNIYGLTAEGWKLHAHHAAPIHRGAGASGPVH
jgi:ketosteroid isomerase-like protein